jgi:hypothetical protein
MANASSIQGLWHRSWGRFANASRYCPGGLMLLVVLMGSAACGVTTTVGEQPTSPDSADPRLEPAEEATTAPEPSSAPAPIPADADLPTVPTVAPGETAVLSRSTRYQDQGFSELAYGTIPLWSQGCELYGLRTYCSYQREYDFADGVLKMEAYSTEGAIATLQLTQPVTVEMGRTYGLILADDSMVLDAVSEQDAEQIVYDETDPLIGGGSVLTLKLDAAGQVTAVSYTVATP